MTYDDVLNACIDDGKEEVREAYRRPDQRDKLDGALRGFEECRGLSPEALLELLASAESDCERKRREEARDYWYWRYRAAQVSWTLNVVNAALHAQGLPVNHPVTARGAFKAAAILGARDVPGLS